MVLEQFGYKICSALREIMGADYDIELREVTKNNGVLLHGVMITGKGSNVSPAVYIDELYEEYEDGNGALQYYGDRRILDQQFSNLKKYANKAETLIEIGCGGGHALKIAGKYFARCTGVEPSEKEIQIAQNMPGGGILIS